MDLRKSPFLHLLGFGEKNGHLRPAASSPRAGKTAQGRTKSSAGKGGSASPSKGRAAVADFTHLAASDDDAGRLRDADDGSQETPSAPCDYCSATGKFGGKMCPMCGGEGSVEVKPADERSRNVVDEITGGGKAASGTTGREAQANAAAIVRAGKVRRGEVAAPNAPKPRSKEAAAQAKADKIVTAGKRRRGEA